MYLESVAMPNTMQALRDDSCDSDDSVNEKTSFTLLIQQHQTKLYNFIYRYTRNRQDAEDLTQDTFVKAFKNFHLYDRQVSVCFLAILYWPQNGLQPLPQRAVNRAHGV